MKFTKLLTGAAFITSLAAAGGSWYLYEQNQLAKSNNKKLESNLVQLEEQNSTLKKQVAEADQLKQEIERLRDQIKDYVGQRDSLKKDVDAANAKASDLQKQIQKIRSEKKDLEEKLNLAKATDSAMVQEAAKLPLVPTSGALSPSVVPPPSVPTASSAKAALPAVLPVKHAEGKAETAGKEAVKTVQKEEPKKEEPKKVTKEDKKKKKEKEKEQEQAKKKEETQPPVAPAAAAAKPAEDSRPQQVLTVNRQFNFVVVNVGLRDKVKIGDVLRVEQNGKLIGQIQVEKLYENFSACAIMEEVKPAQIHEGDLVRVA